MAVRNNFAAGEVLLAADLNDTFAAKLNTSAYTAPGLVLITSESFSAVTSVSINNCFTSTYRNYKLVVRGTATTDGGLLVRLRVSGTDATAGDYSYQTLVADNTTVSGFRGTGQTFSEIASFRSTSSSCEVLVTSPQLAERTNFQSLSSDKGDIARVVVGVHTLATAYTGITLLAGAGNMTGTVRIYGYRD